MNLLIAAVLAAGGAFAEPAMLQDYQVTAKQVTLKLSRPVGYRASATANPPAVVITLDDTRISQAVQEKSVASALVAGIAAIPITNADGESARVVIKLAKKREFSAAPTGNDIVVDLLDAPAGDAAAPAAPAAPATPAAAPETPAAAPEAAAPAAAPPAPVKPAAPAKKASKFLVQIGVFSDQAKADELKKDLDSAETSVEVRKVVVGGKPMFRALVGPARSKAEAKELADKLKGLGYPGLLYKD
ncbi:MAG: SPOR domain-containing protein [Elusimicrobia bacterium]|nr:SPOR domain-containing protein [Elusimicrobiota bacterium]